VTQPQASTAGIWSAGRWRLSGAYGQLPPMDASSCSGRLCTAAGSRCRRPPRPGSGYHWKWAAGAGVPLRSRADRL